MCTLDKNKHKTFFVHRIGFLSQKAFVYAFFLYYTCINGSFLLKIYVENVDFV